MKDNIDTISESLPSSSATTDAPLKILYICTHNRCRSVLSEAITNQLGEGLLIAKSAGSQPAGEVHPLTLKYLIEAGYSVEGLNSTSWDDKEYMQGFEPDLLVTVCDNAAGESCPIWLNKLPNLTKIHWGLTDPSKGVNPSSSQSGLDEVNSSKQKFADTIAIIEKRVARLKDIAKLAKDERKHELSQINLY